MSLPRLSFLYPHLFKTVKTCESKLPRGSPYPRKRPQKSTFSTAAQKREEIYPQRYGTAAEPLKPPPGAADSGGLIKTLANAIEKEVNAPHLKQNERNSDSTTVKEASNGGQEVEKPAETPPESQDLPADTPPLPNKVNGSDKHPREPLNPITKDTGGKSLETVMQIEASAQKPERNKSTHLHAPPYVHHFDTYTLVRDLQKGGFTEDQSVTLMKAVRSLLALNLDIAKQELISKSDIENETYLFRAACSELRTEILNARKASNSKMATQRAHLQHEVDILSQKASQDSLALKDDFRGMLNDRKMAVRMQHQARDSKIQELNYKITVALNSDSKSEVEALRWTLARRAAMAIAGMAIFMLGFLRYSSYKLHEREEQRRLAASFSSSSDLSSQNPSAESVSGKKNHVILRETATQTGDATLARVEGGDVSLG